MKLEVVHQVIDGRNGYDIKNISPSATIQDYLDGLNNIIEKGELTRTRSYTPICEGCKHCCSERIPITNLDLVNLWQSKPEVGNNFLQIIEYYARIERIHPGLDITLQRNDDDTCKFLNSTTGKCTIYANRPLVCQTFICCPLTDRADQLRNTIVNLGEDELVRLWHMEQMLNGSQYEDWSDNPFTGMTDYTEVLIKDICTPQLWNKLKGE